MCVYGSHLHNCVIDDPCALPRYHRIGAYIYYLCNIVIRTTVDDWPHMPSTGADNGRRKPD